MDLSAPQQAIQASHAALKFQHEHKDISYSWYKNSQYLVFLSVSDEMTLIKLIDKFNENGLRVSIFRKPDIDNQITAIAVEPSNITRKLTSNLPLMLKELNNKCQCERCSGIKVESYYEEESEVAV